MDPRLVDTGIVNKNNPKIRDLEQNLKKDEE